jgi:hypothetical protein
MRRCRLAVLATEVATSIVKKHSEVKHELSETLHISEQTVVLGSRLADR